MFEANVIESARQGSNLQELFFYNGVESQQFKEKNEQCFKNEDIKIVATFQSLVHRQQYDEVRAVYLSGQCRLSKEFKKFEIDSLLPWFTRKSKAYRKISFLSS